MLIGGLWHGAAWTFVLWGALHGAGLMIHRWWSKRTETQPTLLRWRAQNWYKAVAGLSTFIFVCLCFVIFRATSIEDASAYLYGLFTFQAGSHQLHPVAIALVFVFGAGTLLGQRLALEVVYDRIPWWLRSVGYSVAFLMLLILTPRSAVPFVYFQF